jgi:hypothetical protein
MPCSLRSWEGKIKNLVRSPRWHTSVEVNIISINLFGKAVGRSRNSTGTHLSGACTAATGSSTRREKKRSSSTSLVETQLI